MTNTEAAVTTTRDRHPASFQCWLKTNHFRGYRLKKTSRPLIRSSRPVEWQQSYNNVRERKVGDDAHSFLHSPAFILDGPQQKDLAVLGCELHCTERRPRQQVRKKRDKQTNIQK